MKMVKAKLEEVGGLGKLEFKFNPSEYSVQKSAQWDAPRRSMSTEAGAKPEFIGTNPQTVNMQIFFDDSEGDTLQSIATNEYGNPNFWRGLARFNDIDDPLRLKLGTRILVPTREEAADGAGNGS